MARAACAEQIALCCAVCLLALSRSDRQYGCSLRGGGNRAAVRDQTCEEKGKRKVVPKNTYYTRYCSIYVQKKAQRSTTQYRSVGHGTAPHGLRTAPTLRCWAIYSWTGLSWACIVIQHPIFWYVQTWCSSTGTYIVRGILYKGSAPRAADAARCARARKISTKYEGGRKRRPMN